MTNEKTGQPHLSKAPVVEAVVDFRVKLPPDFKMGAFEDLRPSLAKHYSQEQKRARIERTVQREEGKPPVMATRDLGLEAHLFRSPDGKNVAAFRRDRFSFSRLEPYTNWEEVFGEAWRLWGLYIECAKPVEVSRLGVRYINRMLFPLPLEDFHKYLTTPPAVANGWPPHLSGFFSRVVLNDPAHGSSANVVQVLEPQSDSRYVELIFDIDAYRKVALNAADQAIRESFGRLRELKNRIFFNGLTAEAIELFK